jgi:hypothetical protein
MNVEVRHTDRTCLNEKAYIKLVRKYAKLKYKLIISFDDRIKAYGQYNFDPNKRTHIIKISPKRNKTVQEESVDETVYKIKTVDSNGEKYQLISTTLHELKHAIQKEELGEAFWNKHYSAATDIKNKGLADFYSECEAEARIYENTNILRSSRDLQ